MKKWVLGGIALVVLIGLCSTLATDEAERAATVAPASEPATPEPPAPSWTEVASWTGTGIKDTETFEIKGREWRIRWESSADGLLQIYAYKGESQIPEVPVNQMGAGEDVSYLRTGPGEHYLKINGMGAWSVTVEDQR